MLIILFTGCQRIQLTAFIDDYAVKRPEYNPVAVDKYRQCFVPICSFFNGENCTMYGTGVVIGQNKDLTYILTNTHVLADLNKCLVNDILYPSKVEYISTKKDIAILSIKGITVEPVKIFRSYTSGDYVSAVGNWQGQGITITNGKIQAVGEVDEAEMILSDVLTNFGCSGGALLNKNGELIGINRAIHTEKLLTYSYSINDIWDEIKDYTGV